MRYEGALRSPIYDLCRQTVTVYHACYNPFRVTRCVIHGAYFERKTVQTVDKSGGKSCDEFLLVIPNKNARRVAPALFNGIPGVYVLECGDRIVEGVGEEITTREQWGSFVPANHAVLGPLDQIFTRIGAADDLASGRLVELLPEFPVPTRPFHLLYTPDRRMTPKLRSFIDFAIAAFRDDAQLAASA